MPINIERPRSALLRGVRITEFKGHIINPDPIILQETDFLLEEFLSPTKLKALTGVNDLRSVKHLEMTVDTSETSLGNFGIYLPNLKQLKLNGSHVPRIRDLGTSLINLKILWLSRSGLTDLDGIPTLNNLEELYLAYNEITDLSPCSMLENLKCLDLEGNLLDEIKQVEFLNLCTNLENLTLYGNPLCVKPSADVDEESDYNYKHEIIKILPSLKILDDELTLNTKPISPLKTISNNNNNNNNNSIERKKFNEHEQHECPFDDDWQLINQFIEEGIGPPEEKLAINESLRPGSSSSHGSQRTNTSVRPLSSMRPLSSYRIKQAIQPRPSSRLTSSNSAGLPGSSSSQFGQMSLYERPNTDPIGDIANDISGLTVGPTLQGNPLKALLARKKKQDPSLNEKNIESNEDQTSFKKPPSYNSTMKSFESDSKNNKNLKIENEELKQELILWKKEHAKKLEERKEYFQPQVLRIDDDYVEPVLSDDEEVNNYYYDETNEYKNKKSNETNSQGFIEINSQKHSNRPASPKTTFKQSFDYEMNASESKQALNEDLSKSMSESNTRIKKKSRSKSRDEAASKQDRISSVTSLNQLNPLLTTSTRKYEREDSDFGSRVATCDKGYASSLMSAASVASFSSSSNLNESSGNLKEKLHQPIIINSSITSPVSLNSVSINSSGNSNNLRVPLQPSLNAKTTLKQLKTNLMPLPGIRMPKN